MGCIFWEKFGRRGVDTLAKSRWADLIGPSIPAEKINHTTINRRGPLYVRRLAVGYSTLGGGGRHGQLVTGRSISMGPPALTPLKHHNQPRFGSVGAESPRERRSGCVLWRALFWNYGRRGDFKASLNCDQADELYCSARLLASKT